MNILFVCTGNTCRSPMAEAIFDAKKLPNHKAKSAGIAAVNGSPASVYAGELCAGVGKMNHCAKQLSAEDISWADLILTMTYAHKQVVKQLCDQQMSVFTLKEFVGDRDLDLADPYGQTKQIYERTFQEIQKAIDVLITKIK